MDSSGVDSPKNALHDSVSEEVQEELESLRLENATLKTDTITLLQKQLSKAKQLICELQKSKDTELKAKDAEIKEIVTQASDFALESPEPAIEELWTDVYAS